MKISSKGFTPTLERALHSFRSAIVDVLSFINSKPKDLNDYSEANAELHGARLVRGFTLLELIIVIGILAILGSVSVLVLNPAELFRQARDSSRVQDLTTIASAIGQYVSSVPDLDLNSGTHSNDGECASGAGGKVYVYAAPTTQSFASRSGGYIATASRAIDGTGWLPIAFSDITTGSPIASMPVDPTNSGDYIYRYACDQGPATYELNGKFESSKYTTGTDEKLTKDGGDNDNFYEIGTDPGLNL